MGKLQINPSTLKVIVSKDSGGNSKLCSTCCIPSIFAPLDNCCFLEPGLPLYSGAVTYNTDDLVEIIAPATYFCGTFRSRVDDNLNNPPITGGGQCIPANEDKWEKVSVSVSCGNESWDAFPPFGGFGKTPAIFTVTAKVIWEETGVTTLYGLLNQFTVRSYSANLTDSDGTTALVQVGFPFLIPSIENASIIWKTFTSLQCRDIALGDTAYSNSGEAAGCSLAATVTDWGEGNGFVKRTGPGLDDCDIAYQEGYLTFSWRPGQIPEWDSGTPYFIGDQVAHEGVFYQCTADNTNQEPPNASYWDVL